VPVLAPRLAQLLLPLVLLGPVPPLRVQLLPGQVTRPLALPQLEPQVQGPLRPEPVRVRLLLVLLLPVRGLLLSLLQPFLLLLHHLVVPLWTQQMNLCIQLLSDVLLACAKQDVIGAWDVRVAVKPRHAQQSPHEPLALLVAHQPQKVVHFTSTLNARCLCLLGSGCFICMDIEGIVRFCHLIPL
jgi:hypothetical protein